MEEPSSICVDKYQIYAHSIDILLGAVSTDEKDIRGLDIMFSKENLN